MKTLLTLFVLLFSSSVVAEDILEFQIEGISIGDSLLDHFSEEKMNNANTDTDYKNKEFSKYMFINLSIFNTYEALRIYAKKNDKKYIIFSISGILLVNKIEDCYIKQNQVDEDISYLFKNNSKVIRDDKRKYPHRYDKSGNSIVTNIKYSFDEGHAIILNCYDYAEGIDRFDQLSIWIAHYDFLDWVQNKAWK